MVARHMEDFEATARFAEAADRTLATLRSAVLWGDALYELGRWQQCEEVFASAESRPGTARDRLRYVTGRGNNLLIGLSRGDEGVAFTRDALKAFDRGAPEWHTGTGASTAGANVGGTDNIANIGGTDNANLRSDLSTRLASLLVYNGSRF